MGQLMSSFLQAGDATEEVEEKGRRKEEKKINK